LISAIGDDERARAPEAQGKSVDGPVRRDVAAEFVDGVPGVVPPPLVSSRPSTQASDRTPAPKRTQKKRRPGGRLIHGRNEPARAKLSC
jgi:hypothetical protein